jgi:molecular chaperone GrpE
MPRDDEDGSVKQETDNSEGKPPEEAPASEERSSRFDNAKAFFRALNAGAEVVPDEFGMKVPGAGDAGRGGPCPSCSHLEAQRAEAEAKATEIENLYKRMAADFENYRKRIDRERDEFKDMGVQQGILEILPALDDLDRAQSHLDENSDPRALKETLVLLYNRFLKCFEVLSIKPIDVIKQPFDPRLHEPVQQVETNEVPEGHVVQELRRGYSFKERIIRPALVNVATPKAEIPEPSSVEGEPSKEKEKQSGVEEKHVKDKARKPESPEDDGGKASPSPPGEKIINIEPGGENSKELSDKKEEEEITSAKDLTSGQGALHIGEGKNTAASASNIETVPKEDEPASESVV